MAKKTAKHNGREKADIEWRTVINIIKPATYRLPLASPISFRRDFDMLRKLMIASRSTAMEYGADDCIIISIIWEYRLRARRSRSVEKWIRAPIATVAIAVVAATTQSVLPCTIKKIWEKFDVWSGVYNPKRYSNTIVTVPRALVLYQ